MAMEMEVKFRTDRETWTEIKRDYSARYQVHHIEQQTNQYYTTADNSLEQLRIGLRLRIVDGRSILCIKRDTKDAHVRQEIEETYPEVLEKLPAESPALQNLLAEVGSSYDQIVPFVMLRTERTIFLLEEQGLQVEVCFDDVSIIGRCREHKLYEVEFELTEGSEERLLQVVQAFANHYGDRVEQSAVSKLAYAIQLVSCE